MRIESSTGSGGQIAVGRRFEIQISIGRNRVYEWQYLSGPKTTDAILAIDPIEKIGQSSLRQRARRTTGGCVLFVDHETQRP